MRTREAGCLLAALCVLALGGGLARAQEADAWEKDVQEAKAAHRARDDVRSERLLRAALREAEKFGPEDFRVGLTLHDLANLAAVQGQYAPAETLYRRALALLEKVQGPEHAQVGIVTVGLADLYAVQGRDVEAEGAYQRGLLIFEKSVGPDHAIVATVLERYAGLLRRVGRRPEAERLEARARTIQAKQPPAPPR